MESYDLIDISKYTIEKNRLNNVMFVMLTQCNANCLHCYIPEHQNYGMDTQRMKGLIKQAQELGALNITFNGGECLLRHDLLELVEYTRKLHMRAFIMSNGIALNEEYVKKLSELHLSEFSTTIFSLKEEIHDKITQVPGSLKKTLQNIELLKKYNIPIYVKTPLMNLNKFEYREIYKYCIENGFIYRVSPSIFAKSDGDKSPHDLQITEDLEIIVKETDEIMDYDNRFSPLNDEKDIICSAPYNTLSIQYDGKVFVCNTLFVEIGNVYEQSLRQIWEKSPKLKLLRDYSKKDLYECEKCELQKKCNRCPGLALLEDGDLLGCSSLAKKLAVCRR